MPVASWVSPASHRRISSAVSTSRTSSLVSASTLVGEGPFDRFFRRRGRRGPPRGANLEVELVIPLEHVATGGEETVRVTRPTSCPTCNGSGAKPGTSPKQCAACAGRGRHVQRRHEGGVMVQQTTICATCHGQGSVIEEPCPECRGQGAIAREEALTVKIPVGVEEGMALRVHVQIPERLSAEERELYEQLRALGKKRGARRS